MDDVEQEDVEYAAKKGKKKIERMSGNVSGALEELWDDIKDMVALLWDYTNGKYPDVPWKFIDSRV